MKTNNRIKKKKLIIFDLDGVLINSIHNMKFALNETNKKLGLKIKFSDYRKYIGLPFDKIMKNLKIKGNSEIIKKNYSYFSKKKISSLKINKKLLNCLVKLKKKNFICIFTSKDKTRTNIILKKYSLFDYIVTSSDVKNGKPNPEGLKKILKKFNIKNTSAIFFGDSYYDYIASEKAKIKFIFVKWGYSKFRDLKTKKKIASINNYKEINSVIQS